MNGADPLAQLRDVHLPEAISAWPPAIGWWILAALLFTGIGFAIRYAWHRHQRRAFLREARLRLQAMPLQQGHSPAQQLQRANDLLKRCAMQTYPQRDIASLHGEDWLDFLNATSRAPLFADKDHWLAQWYRSDVDSEFGRDFIDRAERWVAQQPRRGADV